MTEPSADTRPPRGALIVIAVGLLACLVAAVASTDKSGDAAQLEWVQREEVADSAPVPIPGGGGEMRLTDVLLAATGTNVSGYSLYRTSATLAVSAGSPVGGGRIVCTIDAPQDTEISQTFGGLRATYPRSSDEGGIYKQDRPDTILLDFSSKGGELAVVENLDLPGRLTNVKGVKVEWPEYVVGKEQIKYFLPEGKLKVDMELPFFAVWRTTAVPSAKLGCALKVTAGTATVSSEVALADRPPPIDEEAEEAKAEERAEREEEADEGG